MKKWWKVRKITGAGLLILVTALAAFIFLNMKNSGLNTDNLAGLLGKQQITGGSGLELQNRVGLIKASPTPMMLLKREPAPTAAILPETQETGTAGASQGSSYAAPGVYVEEIQSNLTITGVSTDITAFVGVTQTKPTDNVPPLIHSFSEYQQYYGGFLPDSLGQYGYLPDAVKSYFENGGTRCYIVSVVPKDMNSIVSDDFLAAGIRELESLPDVSIVAVPGIFDTAVQQGFIDHCEAVKDRFAILDMPDTVGDISDLREHRDNFDSSYAAFYHPWLQTEDPETGEICYIPPSGAVAGIYGANDKTAGVHKAPANIAINGIIGLKYELTENEMEQMNPYGINPIRYFSGRGIRVWGARTCSSNDEYKYVNVRRYTLYVNQSIRKGTEWIVYEPNNEQLWARVVQSVDNFLLNEWQNGALMGTNPEQAYFVRMDRTTMTEYDLAQGRRVISFGIAIVKPAEFVVSRVVQ